MPRSELRPEQVVRLIDHTLLKPTATEDDIKRLCREARKYGFASVCVPPAYVSLAKEELRGSGVKVCTVVGFPLGFTLPEVKAFEARKAIEAGADELDMMINLGALKSGNLELVERDIRGVVDVAKERGALVKVIVEACYLTDEEKVSACLLAKRAGADFVKTSTGFGPCGATVHDVKLMRETVGDGMGVKAAGGIRTLEDALAMIEAGASRIGTSAGTAIAEEALRKIPSSGGKDSVGTYHICLRAKPVEGCRSSAPSAAATCSTTPKLGSTTASAAG